MLYLDLETYSEVPIGHGAYRYSHACEILLFAYAFDDEPVIVADFTSGGRVEDRVVETLCGRGPHRICIHNSAFDRAVLADHSTPNFGGYDLPLARIDDTMIMALAHALPGGLEKLCDIYRVPVDQRKMADAKKLIHLFCKPRSAKFKVRRATRETHPAEWRQFVEYARLDIEAMRYLHRRLPRWNLEKDERALWIRDQRINDRGIAVDLDLARAVVRDLGVATTALDAAVHTLTRGAVGAGTERDALLGSLLNDFGVALPDLQAATIERRLEDESLPEPVKDLLRIRLAVSQTSASKFQRMIDAAVEGRLRGMLQFAGASRTERWSGRLVQLQNLPRPDKAWKKRLDLVIDAFTNNAADLLFDPMEIRDAAVNCIRGALVAAPGRKLVCGDLSNIEGRVLAWLAGETWKLKAFADFDAGTGHDLYVLGYASSFHVAPQTVIDDDEAGGTMRLIGKVQELALGYQGAVGAFSKMMGLCGLSLSEERILEIVKAWRKANARIVAFWYALEDAARTAISVRTPVTVGRLTLRMDGNWLRIVLPSGRSLCYPSARIDEQGKLSYMGVHQYTKKWTRISTYGGKLAENATQATARDVLASAFENVENNGFPIVLTVHDELITEPKDEAQFSADRLRGLMTVQPRWAKGLPLAAKAFETHRYRKD